MTDLPASRDAFELLSKPTLQLTDEEVTAICADLRAKRQRFLQGIADKPARKAAKPAVDASPEAKKARTEALKGELDLGNLF